MAVAVTGIGWGLPSGRADRFLFGTRPAWTGQRLVELKGRDWEARRGLGADVDIDPIADRDRPILLTDSDRSRAEILIRYRLYTHQPDEVLTMRALASMRPSQLQLDPKLYQYGGLFIYPVGMLVAIGSWCGLLDAHGRLADYLNHPSDFGAMYVVARSYAALFGLLGVVASYLVGRRLGHEGVGLLAGALFLMMPVAITTSHEGKPHMPGAAMMLWAGWAAMRYAENGRPARWWTLAILCGVAAGMVLSTWLVIAMMAVAILQRPCGSRWHSARRLAGGVLVCLVVFLVANPYLLINTIAHREVLRSNLGTSMGMYEISRIGEGLWTVVHLLAEGMGPALAITGVVGSTVLLKRRTSAIVPLVVVGGLVLLQFACIGAGKPGEYGRFLIFPAAALGIAGAWVMVSIFRWRRVVGIGFAGVLMLATAWDGFRYLSGFVRDAGPAGSRAKAAEWCSAQLAVVPNATVGVVREPAPFCAPPLDFDRRRIVLLPDDRPETLEGWPEFIVATADRPDDLDTEWWAERYEPAARFPVGLDRWLHRPTVISWADKPVTIFRYRSATSRPTAACSADRE
jgi:hypothetical protein